MLTTARVKEGQKPSKMLNWRHCSMRIRAKRKKSLLQHNELPAKPFPSDCMRWEWFKRRNLGSLWYWSQGTLNVVFSPMNNCFSGKKGRVSFIASWRLMKNRFITTTQREESHVDCPVMLLRRRLSRIFTLQSLCCVFARTRSMLFIMRCWNQTKPSLGNGIERN